MGVHYTEDRGTVKPKGDHGGDSVHKNRLKSIATKYKGTSVWKKRRPHPGMESFYGAVVSDRTTSDGRGFPARSVIPVVRVTSYVFPGS